MRLRDFRIGWRLLIRQPFQSAVELLGLATGFAVCFLLLGFVAYSFSYDRDVPQRERVYVIKHRLNFIPQPQWMEYTPFALREVALRSGLPLEASVWWPHKTTASLQGRARELEVMAVDPAFERIAGLRAREGSLQQALTLPDGLAVTHRTALALFGAVDALGKTVDIDGQTLQVRAVLEDRPGNSTLQFGAMVGIGSALWPDTERQRALSNWMGIEGRIYVKTGAGVSATALQKVLQDVVDRAPWQSMATPEMTTMLNGRKMVDIGLGPLADAYFDRSVANTLGSGPRGDIRLVLAMGAAGLLILGLAVVNYVNLATVRTLRRQREIAMRRVLGATTGRLLTQFMAESVLLSLAAVALGMLLAWLLLPLCSELLDRRIDGVFTPLSLAGGLLSGILVGALAGLYPGWLARGVDMSAALAHRSGETAGELGLPQDRQRQAAGRHRRGELQGRQHAPQPRAAGGLAAPVGQRLAHVDAARKPARIQAREHAHQNAEQQAERQRQRREDAVEPAVQQFGRQRQYQPRQQHAQRGGGHRQQHRFGHELRQQPARGLSLIHI